MNLKNRILLCVLTALVLLAGVNHGVWRPDEPLVMGLSAQMARSGDFVVPFLNGDPFLEKPPLYFALGALAARVGGIDNPVAYRSVSLLLALLTLFLTYRMAAQAGGRRRGLLAAGILASAGLFFRSARWIQIDIALVASVTVCMWAYLAYLQNYRARYAALLGLGLGLAFMFKGLVGPACVAAAIAVDLLRSRSLKPLASWKVGLALVCLLLPVIPWVLALHERGGYAFVREVMVVNNFGRFMGSPEGAALGHQKGPLFYLVNFPREFLPWTLLFIPALVAAVKNFRDDRFLPWFAGIFMLLSFSSTKRGVYLLPLFPAAACITASYFDQFKAGGWQRVLYRITWALALIGLLLPFAAIAKGFVWLGLAMGLASLALGSFIYFNRSLDDELKLVGLVVLALSLSGAAFYTVMREAEDYMPVCREVIAKAGKEPIVVLQPDEICDAMLPVFTQQLHEETNNLAIKKPGLYLWSEKDADITNGLHEVRMELLVDRKLGSRSVRLARLEPLKAATCLED